MREFKETSGAPKSRYYVQQGRTWDHLKGASPYGDGGFVVVAGVTSRLGERESRSQGEGSQVAGGSKAGRYA
jgi:hypothetical protein